jgi:hypothetical protein
VISARKVPLVLAALTRSATTRCIFHRMAAAFSAFKAKKPRNAGLFLFINRMLKVVLQT